MLSKRKTRWNVVVVLTCLMLVGFVPIGRAEASKAIETRYTIVDLDSLGGTLSHVYGINNHGQVVGESYLGGYRAFLITPEDTDEDGVPDTWFADKDGDGANDLMIDLGTLATNEGSDSPDATALGINDLGQVVGCSTTDEYVELSNGYKFYSLRAFLITPEDVDGDGNLDWFADDNEDGANDLMVNLGIMNFDLLTEWGKSYAFGISNSGHVVGIVSKDLGMGEGHAFVIAPEDSDNDGEPDTWFADEDNDGYNDLMIDLGKLEADDRYISSYDVSDTGQVVGWSSGGAFLITPEDVDGDGDLDWFSDAGDGINALMIELESLGIGEGSTARAINSSGQIVGSSIIGEISSTWHAVIWEADTTTPTELPGDIKGYSVRATGINDSGRVVGYGRSSNPSSAWGQRMTAPTDTAFVWEDGAIMTPLTDLIEGDIEADDMTAVDINNSGQIVGAIGSHAYIAVPIPESSQP